MDLTQLLLVSAAAAIGSAIGVGITGVVRLMWWNSRRKKALALARRLAKEAEEEAKTTDEPMDTILYWKRYKARLETGLDCGAMNHGNDPRLPEGEKLRGIDTRGFGETQ